MTLAELFLIVVCTIFGAFGYAVMLRMFDLRRANFKKQLVPSSAGIAFVVGGTMFYGAEWYAQGLAIGTAAAYLLVVVAFGLLGLADDMYGSRVTGGFRGHFGSLLKGKITTGAVKAIVGMLAAVGAAFLFTYPLWAHMAIAACLIALSANAINLLDLRPGRCLFATLVLGAMLASFLLISGHSDIGFLLYFALGAALVLYPLDAAGLLMLGDTGSNVFGALLGLAAAMWLPTIAQILVILLLAGFHVWAEKHSLSAWIESVEFLRKLDSKIGIR